MARVAAHSARRPRPVDLTRWVPLPAPILGLDAVSPVREVDARHALVSRNVVAGDGGLKARPGFMEHDINVGSGEVRSILPYHSGPGQSKLFAGCNTGIYDVTVSGGGAVEVYTFATSDANSGYGEGLGFVNSAGAHFLIYTDETNGYHLYTESTGLWTLPAITGVARSALVHVAQWGSRLWFTERDSTRGWYLAPGAISGVATSFDFGPQFPRGGVLRGIWSWTRDGGSGMNDLLVAVSSNGDVVVYSGTDPSFATTFGLVGRWNVGAVPAGRRLVSPYGGDLQLLTTHGLLSLNRLVQGQVLTPDTYQSDSIRPLITGAMATTQGSIGWHITVHPRDAFLMVNSPNVSGRPQEQFAMSLATRGWSTFRGLDILSSDVWQGDLYFGTRDGRVCKSTGFIDNVKLGGVLTDAAAIECTVLGGFSTLGGFRRKFVRGFRPAFLTRGFAPTTRPFVRFDFDTSEPTDTLIAPAIVPPGVWDAAIWDSSSWGDYTGSAYPRVGTPGVGTWIAPGVRFITQDYAVLTGYDIAIEEGAAP